MCKIYDDHHTLFASASSDRTIKIWRPISEDGLGHRVEELGEDSGPNSLQNSGTLQSHLNQSQNYFIQNQSEIVENSAMDFEGDAK